MSRWRNRRRSSPPRGGICESQSWRLKWAHDGGRNEGFVRFVSSRDLESKTDRQFSTQEVKTRPRTLPARGLQRCSPLRARLTHWVFQRKCLELHAGIEDTLCRRIGRRIRIAQHLGAGQMCDQADVGDGWLVATAETAGAMVTRKYAFDCPAGFIEPVPEPLHPGRLIDMKLLFEIFSHPRDDKGMRIHSHHLSKRSYMRARTQIRRHERWVRILLFQVFKDRERLHQWRTVTLQQSRHNHLRIDRPIGRIELVALEQIQRNRFGGQPFQAQRDAYA